MPTFYEISSVHASAREHWWGCKGNPVEFAIVMIAKILRIRTPMASDDANVDSTFPCVVESLSAELLKHFEPLASELTTLGFTDPVYHEISDAGTQTRIYWATYRHTSGQFCARIHNRYWDRAQKKERALFPLFFTFFGGGSFLLSSSGRPDMAAPPMVEMKRLPGAKTSDLWASHLQLTESLSRDKAIAPIHDRNEVICATENLHVLQRNYHLQRGVFQERSAVEVQQAQNFAATVEQVRADGSQHPEIIAEIVRLEEQKPRWTNAIWVLVVSFAVFFLAAGAAKWNWNRTLWLIPILLFHETGHWLAMRVFGYRNLRMFFIPLFGAAVSGQHRNVAGWKKAVVSLAGPLPGIGLGVICAIAAHFTNQSWLREGALLLVFINGFNLIPILPLDGGRFLQTTLFCRNRWLDIIFRIVAVIGLIFLAVEGLGRFLGYIAVVLAMGLPLAFKISRIIDRFRREPLPPALPGEDRISRPTAETLIAAVKSELPTAANKVVAQNVLNIYETLNARPPGVAATAGLLSLYGGAIVVAVICFLALSLDRAGGIGDFLRNAISLPRHNVDLAAVEVWRGSEAASQASSARNHVVATLRKGVEARKEFEQSVSNLPPNATAVLFGDTIIVGLPGGDKAASQQWIDQFHTQTTNTLLLTNNTVCLSLSFDAPTKLASTNLHESLQGFVATGMTNLIPPWDPAASSAAFSTHLEARRVWTRLDEQLIHVWQDPSVTEYTREMVAASKRRDSNELARLGSAQMTHFRQLEDQVCQRLSKEYATTPYASMVDYKRQLIQGALTNKTQRAEMLARFAEQLGSFGPGQPSSATMAFGPLRRGLQFRLPWLMLSDPETNLPELVQWLTKQGCSHIRYDFRAFDAEDDDPDN
jgi:Zn-dependent protease